MNPRYLAIAYSCAIDRDPAQNTVNHQEMVDFLGGMIAGDGWDGVRIMRLESVGGRTFIEISPGVIPLTLDYLRSFRKRSRENAAKTDAPETGADMKTAEM